MGFITHILYEYAYGVSVFTALIALISAMLSLIPEPQPRKNSRRVKTLVRKVSPWITLSAAASNVLVQAARPPEVSITPEHLRVDVGAWSHVFPISVVNNTSDRLFSVEIKVSSPCPCLDIHQDLSLKIVGESPGPKMQTKAGWEIDAESFQLLAQEFTGEKSQRWQITSLAPRETRDYNLIVVQTDTTAGSCECEVLFTLLSTSRVPNGMIFR